MQCIYCGRTIGEHESYCSGTICGVSNSHMCGECMVGPGKKYIDATGTYYERAARECKREPEPKKRRSIIQMIAGIRTRSVFTTVIFTAIALTPWVVAFVMYF